MSAYTQNYIIYISQNLPIKKLNEGNKINTVDLTISLISQ